MHLEILSPEKKLFEGDITGIRLPGVSGSFELLDKHAPLVSALNKGTVYVKTSSGDKTFEISSGFVECLNNKVIVLVEGATGL